MNTPDIRWQQRFANFKKALVQLKNAVELSKQRPLSLLEKQGVIQAFEFTHELAWNVLKDYLEDQGNQSVKGSKDATREAFKVALIADGEQWMAMIQSRNVSSHTYDEQTAEQLVVAIINDYFPLFERLQTDMQKYLPNAATAARLGLSQATLDKLNSVFLHTKPLVLCWSTVHAPRVTIAQAPT